MPCDALSTSTVSSGRAPMYAATSARVRASIAVMWLSPSPEMLKRNHRSGFHSVSRTRASVTWRTLVGVHPYEPWFTFT